MYSWEDRMKAVTLYIESKFSENQVIKSLGYPSPNTLRSWYREYVTVGSLHTVSRCKPHYSPAQKEAAVSYFADHHTSFVQRCRAVGYPGRNLLRAWVQELRPDLLQREQKPCKTKRTLVRYSQDEKRAIVEEWMISRIPIYHIAAKYGVSRAAISAWKRQILGKEARPSMKKKADANSQFPEMKAEMEAEIAQLKAEIHRLRIERDALQVAAELLKKAEGISLEKLTNREKAKMIDALRNQYRLKELLGVFHIAKSSYCYQEKSQRNCDKYETLRQKIQECFYAVKECYGYRRIHHTLKRDGIHVSEKVIRRLMREEGLRAHGIRRRKFNSYVGEVSPAAPNLLQRDFHALTPNSKWLTDITEFAIPAGKVYLSPIIDCFDGLVVSWTIGTSPSAALANEMLDRAIVGLKAHEHPILHSDRGGHYRWPGWIERTTRAGLPRSMSKKGYSPDNAACEGFFGRLKNEMFYRRDWAHVSIEDFTEILDSYIQWYNTARIKESLGWMSPVEYRTSLGLL